MLTQTWQAGGLGKAAVDGGAVWPDFSSGGGCRNYDLHVALWSVVTAGTIWQNLQVALWSVVTTGTMLAEMALWSRAAGCLEYGSGRPDLGDGDW